MIPCLGGVQLPSSRRRNENNTRTATTRYAGYTECVLPEGHPGDHEDEDTSVRCCLKSRQVTVCGDAS